MGLCLMLLFLASYHGVVLSSLTNMLTVMEAKLQTATSSGAEYSTISKPEVGALDGPQVLLVALPGAGILVQHVGGDGHYLALNDGVQDILGLHRFPGSSFSLILLIQRLELLSQDLMQSWTLHVETNSSSRLRDEGALHQGVIDALDTVAVHGEEEAAAELVPGGGSVEQGGEMWVNSFRDKRMFSIALSIPSPWMTTDTLIDIC